jgi:ribonuclease P protein component
LNKGFKFRKEERISLDREIERVIQNGRSVSNEQFTLVWLDRYPQATKTCRFAVRFERRFGNAVDRNRTKRFLKETFRMEKWNISPNMDIIMIVKPFLNMRQANYFAIKQQFIYLCKEARIWRTA